MEKQDLENNTLRVGDSEINGAGVGGASGMNINGNGANGASVGGGSAANDGMSIKGKRTRKDTWIFAGVIAMLVLAAGGVGLGVYLVVRNAGTNNESSSEVSDETEEITEVVNTDLTSGTVTTTIGGKSVTYSGAYVVDGVSATIDSGTYASTTDDQAVFLVINGGSLTITGDVAIKKSGSADFQGRGDNYSFYGTNSAVVVVGEGSTVSLDGVAITTDVSGANAVVATNGGKATVKNATIETSKDNSRGLHATYTGEIEAENVSIATQGGSSASLATDRGEGTVTASNMTLSTAGAGSPLIYSTGEITVSSSTGTATGAQIAVVEGKNSITLSDCEFSANGVGNRNNVDNAAVMIYQSMSGDAGVGTGTFTATNSKLMVLSSSSVYNTTPFFFVTNTNATISLSNVEANFSTEQKFISALGTDEWGKSGSNGGTVTVTAENLTATNTETNTDSISSVSGL